MRPQYTARLLSVNGKNMLCDVTVSVGESDTGNVAWRRITFETPVTIMADEDLVICDPTHGVDHG